MAGWNPFRSIQKKAAQSLYVTVVSPSQHNFGNLFSTAGNITASQLIANFETIPDLYKIENFIAKKVGSIPVKVVKPSGREAKNSELNRIVNSPNEHQSWRELIRMFSIYYGVTGNAYLYGIEAAGLNQITSLYCLPVEKVEIVLESDKRLPAWMNRVAAYKVNIGGIYYTIAPDFVLHEKNVSLRYDDGSWVYGMSKYIPGDKVNRELKAIHDARTSIIEQRGAMGFVTNESEIPDAEQSKAVKERLAENYGVLDGQDKIIVTTERLRWQQMALGIPELQLIENAKLSFNDLCQINEIDPIVFSTEGSTYANKAEAKKSFVRDVLKPYTDNIYLAISEWLSPYYGGDMIVPDWSQVEEMQDDIQKKTTVLVQQIENAIITPYRAHEILYGEVTGENQPPDVYMKKSSLVPVDEPETPESPDDMNNSDDPEDETEITDENGN